MHTGTVCIGNGPTWEWAIAPFDDQDAEVGD